MHSAQCGSFAQVSRLRLSARSIRIQHYIRCRCCRRGRQRRCRCRSLCRHRPIVDVLVAAAAAITAAISCTLLRDTSTSCRTHPRAASRAAQPRALHRTLHRALTRRTAPSRAAPPRRRADGPPAARARLRRAVSCGACGGPSPAAPAAGRGVEASNAHCVSARTSRPDTIVSRPRDARGFT